MRINHGRPGRFMRSVATSGRPFLLLNALKDFDDAQAEFLDLEFLSLPLLSLDSLRQTFGRSSFETSRAAG
jgi:hypothetical protein